MEFETVQEVPCMAKSLSPDMISLRDEIIKIKVNTKAKTSFDTENEALAFQNQVRRLATKKEFTHLVTATKRQTDVYIIVKSVDDDDVKETSKSANTKNNKSKK